jgi:hypothetical protein
MEPKTLKKLEYKGKFYEKFLTKIM